MAVRSNTDTALDEDLLKEEKDEEWVDDSNGSDVQVRLDRHALVSHGKQIAAVQEQMTKVVVEMASLRRLCASARNHAKKTNAMLETLGKHLGVQLDSPSDDSDDSAD